MSKRSAKLFRWRITRIKASPAALIGYVEAPDQDTAIRTAIQEFEITNPEHQKRLVAQRAE
jgi:hypothetical protein